MNVLLRGNHLLFVRSVANRKDPLPFFIFVCISSHHVSASQSIENNLKMIQCRHFQKKI